MKIATYNVNGVNGRLSRLLEWLNEASPDFVCVQELKTDDTSGSAACCSTRSRSPRRCCRLCWPRIYTFWVNREAFLRNRGMRLDFLLVSAPLARRLQSSGVDAEFYRRDKPSDHAPAWIVVSDKA